MKSQIISSPHLPYFLIYTSKTPWLSVGCTTVSAQWGTVNRDIWGQPWVAQSQKEVKAALPFRYKTTMQVATKLITFSRLWARKEGSRELESRSKKQGTVSCAWGLQPPVRSNTWGKLWQNELWHKNWEWLPF